MTKTSSETEEKTEQKPTEEMNGLKMILDLGPVILIFLTNYLGKKFFGLDELERIITSTSVFIVATLIAMIITYIKTRKISGIAVFSTFLVLFFGGMTVYLQDKSYFQLKFTLINGFFGLVILVGLAFKKSLLELVLKKNIKMTEEGWRKFSFQWAFFFLVMAALNEVLRRTVDWDTWTNIKTLALLPLMFLFIIVQTIFMMKYMILDGSGKPVPLSDEDKRESESLSK